MVLRTWLAFLSVFALGAVMLVFCGDSGENLCEGVLCDDGNECTEDTCDPDDGSCDSTVVADDSACNFQGLPGLCKSGVCEDATLCEGVVCDDDNQCTEDRCDPANGSCSNSAVAANTACSVQGFPGICVSGVCEDAMLCEGVVCDDENQCTEDFCRRATGRCSYAPVANATACNFHGLPGLCMSGVCEDAKLCEGVVCDDENQCTEDICDPANGSCVHDALADNTVCSFHGLPGLCMSGVCEDAGLCEGIVCDDGKQCTEDICDPANGTCVYTPLEDDTSCNFNGFPGVCASGMCEDAMLCEGVVCDSPCAIDEPPCNPFTGMCPPATTFATAGLVCDLDTIDDGLCDGGGNCIEPQGDLEPIGISFDTNNFLQVVIKNRSGQTVPKNVGNVQVFVDGRAVADIGLESLVDDSYRQPNSMQTITLDVRIAGANRRIGIAVDTSNEILETNEDHNQYTRTVTPPVIPGPDLVVSDLRIEDSTGALQIELRNDGTEDCPITSVTFEIRVNGVVIADVTQTIPALSGAGGTTLVSPTPSIPIGSGSKVKVTLSTKDPRDEIDNTNQSRTELLPSDALPAEYSTLLVHPKIVNNLKWEGASGVSGLTNAQMADLVHAIHGLEAERPVSAPLPPVEPVSRLTEETAWHIFVAHVAHSLWVEKNDLVGWSLVDIPDAEAALLLDGRQWFYYLLAEDRYTPRYGWVTPWNPTVGYEFLSNFEMIKSNQLDTIYALTDWMRARLFHNSGQDPFEQYGYEGHPPIDRILYALDGRKHITPGCGGTTGLYISMLRAINIPAELAQIIFDESHHCRPIFQSVDRSMTHGDDPYNTITLNSSRTVPVSELFYTSAQMQTLFVSPVPDCNGAICNTVSQQAFHNNNRQKIERSFQRRGDYLLRQYQQYGPDHLRDVVLHGIQVGGETITYAYPLFSATEKDAMILAIEDYLTTLGGGDIEAGKAIVSIRATAWDHAKNSIGMVLKESQPDEAEFHVHPECP
jgi:hypothetical protein